MFILRTGCTFEPSSCTFWAWSGGLPPTRRGCGDRTGIVALLGALLLAGLTGACAPRADGGPLHLLLITLDTARADRFSYAGPSPVETPAVDTLAAEGTAFLQAVSPVPVTLPAHVSILTGLLPPAHGVRNNGTYRLADGAVTLAERLAAGGYRTGAFVGASVLDARYGLDQGFEVYDDEMPGKPGAEFEPQRRAEEVVERTLAWLDGVGEVPSFAWVHLFDPHMPYNPPEPERSRYPGSPYDGEIAYADRMIGRLLDGYRDRGLDGRTLVVFTADHGEALGEHGELTHGVFLFEPTVRVPLVMRMPGQGGGRRVAEQARLIDIVPTVLDLLGLGPAEGLDGRSLVPLLRGDDLEPVPAYLETRLPLENHGWFELRGVRTPETKLITGPTTELYDLVSDPGETTDLAARRAGTVGQMLRDLDDRAATAEAGSEGAGERVEMDEATRRQLTALGYVSSGASSEPSADGLAPYEERRVRLTLMLRSRGFRALALERCGEIFPVTEAGRCLDRLAESLPEAAADAAPRPGDNAVLGGSPEELLAVAEAAAGRGDHETLQGALTELTGRLEATARGRAPSPPALRRAARLSRIGTGCFERLQYDDALHAFLLGERLVPEEAVFSYNLGLAWERLGDVDEALRAFSRTLELAPGFARAQEHRRYMEAVRQRLEPPGGPETGPRP